MKKPYFRTLLKPLLICGMLPVSSLSAQNFYGLTKGNEITTFTAANPAATTTPILISGIMAGQEIVGIDFRPNTGQLYALGYNKIDSTSNVYTINKTSGVANLVGSSVKLALGDGSKVGFDFNPTVDRIRVVAGNDKNYRLHPVTGAIAATDGNLQFAGGDVNKMLNPNIAASAYTNSYIGAGSTVLYNYDDSLQAIVRQDPPNNGTLNTVGSTGFTTSAGSYIGFDIVRNTSNMDEAFLSVGGLSATTLYKVNLKDGSAMGVGMVGENLIIKDLAAEIDRTLPTIKGNLLYALQGTNLISFDSEAPQIIRSLVAITGVTTGQTISGMDFRPKTGELFILGYSPTDGLSQLYTLNPASGVAMAISATTVNLMLGTGPIGMDFNPTVDRVRIVGANNVNYRLNPITGGIAAIDTALAYSNVDANNGKDPFISSVAYTNSFDGAKSTQLFGYDDSLNVLVLQSPPNRGTLNTIGKSSLVVNIADASTDLDIYYDKLNSKNIAYLITNTGSSTADSLYSLDVTTGAVMNKGMIGNGISIRDIAAVNDTSSITGIFSENRIRSTIAVNMFPNPITDNASVEFELSENSEVEIRVTNAMGMEIQRIAALNLAGGRQTVVLPTTNFKPGIYIFEIVVNGQLRGVVKGSK